MDFPVIVRYSSDEWVPGGRELAESIEVAKVLERAGVAALDISQCVQESPGAGFDPMQYPEGWTVFASEAIKKAVTIPVIISHSLRNPDYCEKILQEGKTDMIGLSRQLLADPYWPLKAREGRVRAIRRCISCLTGCWQESMMAKKEIGCAINPACGSEEFARMAKTAIPLKIAVVGGGPAGMETARIATERGTSRDDFREDSRAGRRHPWLLHGSREGREDEVVRGLDPLPDSGPEDRDAHEHLPDRGGPERIRPGGQRHRRKLLRALRARPG